MVALKNRTGGFTLLEVLVALVLLTLFSVASYRALDSVLTTERHALAEMARWRQLALAFSRVKTDLANAVSGIETRNGMARGLMAGVDNAGGAPYLDLDRLLPEDQAGGIQRVGYIYRDNTLLRRVWNDSAPATTPPVEGAILDGLAGVDLRYLDQDGKWYPDWGPVGRSGSLPRAVEMRFRFDSAPPLRRVFLLQ